MSFLMIIGICLAIFVLLFLLGRGTGGAGGSALLLSRLSVTVQRFRYAVAASMVMTGSGVLLVGHTDNDQQLVLAKLLAVSALVLPLLVVARLRSETSGKGGLLLPLIAAMALLYFFLIGDIKGYSVLMRHGLWTLCAYLLLLLFPFNGRDEAEDAWSMNLAHVQAFLVGFVWAFVLYLGLVAALAGMDYLLAVKIPSNLYLKLWIVMSGFVGVVVYLSALPADIHNLRQDILRSGMPERFVRNVLVPLVVIYLFILYAYAGKIIINASWPKGGVAGFILGFCGVGILTYLLLPQRPADRPVRHIELFRSCFFPLVLPLALLLFLSVWRRVSDYGVTEIRYAGVVSAFWLAGISLYFVISRKKDHRILLASVCLICFAASFGPWGAISVSAASQSDRLRLLLEKHGILSNGQLQTVTSAPEGKELVQINQTIKYLHRLGRTGVLVKWSGGKIGPKFEPCDIAAKIGIPYMLYENSAGSYFNLRTASDQAAVMTEGYKMFWSFSMYGGNAVRNLKLPYNEQPLVVSLTDNGEQLLISYADSRLASFSMSSFIEQLRTDFPGNVTVPAEKMVLTSEDGTIRLALGSIGGKVDHGKPRITSMNGFLLYGR